MDVPICPLAKAVHHVRSARRHMDDAHLGAAIIALYTAATWLGFADGEDLASAADRRRRYLRGGQVRAIVHRLAMDLGVLADVRCALIVRGPQRKRGADA